MDDTLTPIFAGFPKIPRLSRPCVVTEKIDGTNAQIYITEECQIYAGSRNRWLTLYKDNYSFCRWVEDHREELLQLGPGRHFGEWWGQDINRGYDLTERRFSLFNVGRWDVDTPPPTCCTTVPILGRFEDFSKVVWDEIMDEIAVWGSLAAPGYRQPEGIVVYHTAGNVLFKKTFEKDTQGKEWA